ncbi:MAG: 5,6-dimethylbenzimidazole synthase [Nitrospinaceae bacterium]|jgi:5,6-dimethylbenzimidazole synthase|nr:5,6-dimethylbenzimidazole synthase [Nitrospina sp.]MBT5867585.1 5,6-dimethylbenzimidazole synthase [Nitrospinaceae bacterium]
MSTILITGGSRSGKSSHALDLTRNYKDQKLFIATAEPLDDEMAERIKRHQDVRGEEWLTLEEPLELAKTIRENAKRPGYIVVDCITLWLINMVMQDMDRISILERVKKFIEECKCCASDVIVITNELGSGIVPMEKSARLFRDIAGETNQILASEFDEVVSMISGIPMVIKTSDKTSHTKESAEQASEHEFTKIKKQGLYEAIYKRRDMRHFIKKPVDPEKLGRVLDAAHHAGSVGYMQPWNFLVITDPEVKNKIALNFKNANEEAAQNFSGDRKQLYNSLKLEGILDAPVNICVTCDRTRFGPNVLGRNTVFETDLFSTCCAVQNLWLAARAEGLAVGWVSILSHDKLKEDLDIPDHIQPVAYLCVGHTESFYNKPMLETAGWAQRLPVEKLIYYNKWQGDPSDYRVHFSDMGEND